jgi:hypothetical protein
VSLRARLVAAFFVILLAPMLLIAGVGYLAFGGVAGKGAQREAVRTVVTAACHRLTAEAESLAVLASARGEAYSVTDATVAQPWAICGVDPESVLLPAGTRYVALAARAEVRDDKGATIGYAYAVQRVDTLLDQLAAAAGCRVQLLGTGAVSTDAEQPLPLACPTAAASPAVGGLTWSSFRRPRRAAGHLLPRGGSARPPPAAGSVLVRWTALAGDSPRGP